MTYTPSKSFTVDEFIAQYGEISGYELADGELIDRSLSQKYPLVVGPGFTKVLAISQSSFAKPARSSAASLICWVSCG